MIVKVIYMGGGGGGGRGKYLVAHINTCLGTFICTCIIISLMDVLIIID